MTDKEKIGWGMALAGAICGIAAAWLKTDLAGALAAASASLTALSATWGVVNRPATPPATTSK